MTQRIPRVIVIVLAMITAVVVVAPNADATVSTFTWGSRTRVASDVGAPDLTTVSCPTTTFCMSLDHDGTSVRYDGSTWTRTLRAVRPGAYQVSCTSATFCMATAVGGFAQRWDGVGWHTLGPVPGRTLSCATPTFCLTADGRKAGQTSSYYAIWDGTAFRPTRKLANTVLLVVSCTAVNSCIGLSSPGFGSSVVSERFDGTTWSDAKIVATMTDTAVLSCVGSICLAANRTASAVYDGSTWTSAGAPPVTTTSTSSPVTPRLGLSCVSASFCALISGDGSYRNSATAEVTTFDGSSWASPTTLFTDGLAADRPAVSCVSPSFCVAVTDAVTSRYSGSSWSAVSTIDPDAGSPLPNLSCATPTFCIAAGDNDARVWKGSAWAPATTIGTVVPPIDGDSYRSVISDVSCVSSTFCVATLSGTANPVTGGGWARWDGTSWTTQERQRSYAQLSVSCVSTTFCVSIGHRDTGGTQSWTPSVFDGTSWTTSSSTFGAAIEQVSCVSSAFCMAIGPDAFSRWDGTAWSPPTPFNGGSPGPSDIACLTPARCFATDYNEIAQFTPAGLTYALINSRNMPLTSISCSVGAACITLGPAVTAAQYRGKGVWSAPFSVASFGDALAISCPTASFCMTTDDIGYATIGRAT